MFVFTYIPTFAKNLLYLGMCKISFVETQPQPGGNPDSFQLGQLAAPGNTAQNGLANCNADYITIPTTCPRFVTGAAIAVLMPDIPRFCGGVLATQNGQISSGTVACKYFDKKLLRSCGTIVLDNIVYPHCLYMQTLQKPFSFLSK